MPSVEHEVLVALFRNRPRLAAELLSSSLGVALPRFDDARIESADLTEVVPATYRADLVVVCVDPAPVQAVIVEVQLTIDAQKRLTWPLYLAAVRARLGCATCLLIVAPEPAVERWAREPIDSGHPGHVLTPLVLGSESVPRITDNDEAEQRPELAILSVLAHGAKPDALEVGRAAIHASLRLDEERSKLYTGLVLSSLGDAARAALEEQMKLGNYPEPTDLEKRILARGEARGRAEGKAEGKAEGEARGEAQAVLTVLEARGFDVPVEVRERILACRELARIEMWLRRAVSVASVDEVFAGE